MNKINTLTKVTLLLISMTTMMSNVAIITIVPRFKDYFLGVANIEFLSRLMITLPSLSIALLAPILSHFIFKFGRRKSAIFALFLFGLTGTSGLYLETLNLLLISRSLLGIAIAILMIVATSLVGDYFKGDERHKFMGLQSAFIALGGVTFVFGGGILSDFNWRFPFAVYAIGFVLLPFAIKFLDDTIKHQEPDDDENLNPNLFGIYFLAFLLMLVFYIMPTQTPFLIINKFGASGSLTGGIISFAFLANALGAISFRKLKRKFSFEKIYVIGMVILGIGFITIGLVTNVHYFFFTSSIMGFGGGVLMTNVSAWMLHFAHHTKRIKASGYLTSSLFFGQFFSPIVFHPLVSYFGVQHFFMVMGLFLISCVAMLYLRKVIFK